MMMMTMMMHAEVEPELAVVRELRLLLPRPGDNAPDPASSSFCRIVDGLNVEHENAINPHVETIIGPLGEWAQRHGLAEEEKIARRLDQVCFNVLVAHTYPKAPYDEFLLAAKWCTWLFFHDDWLCDRQVDGELGIVSPEELAIVHHGLLDVLGGRAPSDDPLERSLAEFAGEVRRWGGDLWMERFTQNVGRHFEANEWEAENRAQARVPSIRSYVEMRPYAGAVYTAFDFIDLVQDLDIDPALRSHDAFCKLALQANNCICWVNDLYSLAKEIFEGNPNNLVLALREEEGICLAEAMARVVEMHNDEYRAFERLAGELGQRGLVPERDLRAYLDGLRSWMLGNAAWSRLTLRYQDLLNMTV